MSNYQINNTVSKLIDLNLYKTHIKNLKYNTNLEDVGSLLFYDKFLEVTLEEELFLSTLEECKDSFILNLHRNEQL